MTSSKLSSAIIRWIPVLLLTGLFIYLMVWRVRVGMTRFFDVDEFSYLHWSANVAKGLTPYKDFFDYVSPGFIWLLAPFIRITGVSTQVFLVGRVIALVIFIGILTLLSVLFGLTRSLKWALLPAVILAFLPMPYDKFFEIRPDNLSTFFALSGLVLEVIALMNPGKRERLLWFFAGFAYMTSLLVLVKTIPFAFVGLAIAVVSAAGKVRRSKINIVLFLGGFFIPLFGFFLWTVATGSFAAAWYLLTRVPFEINNNMSYYMVPNLFFYPNIAFYGGDGQAINFALVVNHILWIIGLGMGAYRLYTPYLTGRTRGRVLAEILIGLIFFSSVAAFVLYFPEKFSQYLIPIAVFVAYYAADAVSVFFDWLTAIGGWGSLCVVLIGFTYVVAAVTRDVNTPKLLATNTIQLQEVAALIHTVSQNSRVVDLDGRMIFWPEGYPICCLPFDTYLPSFSKPIPSLALYLPAHPADYVYDGYSGRFATLSAEDATYVQTYFSPVPGWGNRLWKKK